MTVPIPITSTFGQKEHLSYAQLLAMLARHDEAFAEIESARQCDPVSPMINAFLSYILLEARQYDGAVVAGVKAVEFDPTAPLPHFLLGRAYAKVGEFQLAIDALTEAVRIAGNVPRFEGSLGYAYARAGRRTEAEAILNRFSRGPLAAIIPPVEPAMISLGLGDTDAALIGLEAAFAARLPGTVTARDPFFSELALEPRLPRVDGPPPPARSKLISLRCGSVAARADHRCVSLSGV